MTVLIGVLCEDGVVIGSDSSATFGVGNFHTIEQTAKKVFKVGDDLIFAGTGQVGCGQRFEDILGTAKASHPLGKTKPMDFARQVTASFIKDMAFTHAPTSSYGALVGWHGVGGFSLVEFDVANFQPEFKRDESWFGTMGGGQPLADPFMAFISRVMFKGKKPNLREGLFAVYWALEHAIELNTGGINGPIQIATISKPEGRHGCLGKIISVNDELSEHPEMVKALEKHIGDFRGRLLTSAPSASAPPVPPPPEPR